MANGENQPNEATEGAASKGSEEVSPGVFSITANSIGADKKTVEATITAEKRLGKDLDEAVSLFGKEAVYGLYLDKAIISVQGIGRGGLKRKLSTGEIKMAIDAWVPGQGRRAVDPIAATLSRFADMSPEDQLAFLNQLKGMRNK